MAADSIVEHFDVIEHFLSGSSPREALAPEEEPRVLGAKGVQVTVGAGGVGEGVGRRRKRWLSASHLRPRHTNDILGQLLYGGAAMYENTAHGLGMGVQELAQAGGMPEPRLVGVLDLDGHAVPVLHDEIDLVAPLRAPEVDASARRELLGGSAQVQQQHCFEEAAQLTARGQAGCIEVAGQEHGQAGVGEKGTG